MPVQRQTLDPFSTEHLHADLKGRSVRGGVLTVTSQGIQFLTQSTATVMLARLLTPADFGLVAMVTAITSFGQAFADLGLSEATIQCEELVPNQVSTLFWMNVAIGAALMLLTAILAPVLAWFYREPRLIDITLLLSITFLIGGLRVQHDALLRRQMRYSSLMIRDVVSSILAVFVSVTMAWRGTGYWALIALPLTLNLIQMALSWLMVRWVPGLPRRDAKVRSLVTFGGNVAASYLLDNISQNVDNVLIGWYWGPGLLGIYSRAYNLSMLPVRQLGISAQNVAVPAFSRVQSDPERFARYYLRVINLMMWISAPIFGFLFVAAEPVIVLVLGSKWREAAPVFQILAMAGLAQQLRYTLIWPLVSCGDSKRLFKLSLIISPVMVAGFVIGLPIGIKGVALAGSLALLGILPWVIKLAFRGTSVTLRSIGQAILFPISVCFAGVVLAELALHLIGTRSLISQILVVGIGFGVAYSLAALIYPVRQEIKCLGRLLSELRFPKQPV